MKLTLRKYLILLFTAILIFTSCSNEIKKNSAKSTDYEENKLIKNKDTFSNEQAIKNNVNIDDLSQVNEEHNSNEIEINSKINEEILKNTTAESENLETIKAYELPKGFVYVDDIIPNIVVDAKYYTGENFIGRKIDGYEANLGILTIQAAESLKKVQKYLNSKGLGLKIFDGYRPQMAVDHFTEWAANYDDTLMKDEHYPRVKKSTLFSSGYIAHKSGHSRGSTVDLTIIDLGTMEELDMGTPFDFFGVEAHFYYDGLTNLQKENRNLLKSSMEKYGLRYYKNEWWHYTLNNEPFKKKYFDFAVK